MGALHAEGRRHAAHNASGEESGEEEEGRGGGQAAGAITSAAVMAVGHTYCPLKSMPWPVPLRRGRRLICLVLAWLRGARHVLHH